MSNQIIYNQVDLMLFEEGRFSVINWLLREGYLDFIDYRKWRNGEAGYLEDHFKATIPAIIADLEIAQRYAKKLKLESFRHSYTSVANQTLHFCRALRMNSFSQQIMNLPKIGYRWICFLIVRPLVLPMT